MGSRTLEMVLGLIGGLVAIALGAYTLFLGAAITAALGNSPVAGAVAGIVTALAVLGMILGVVGLLGAWMVNKNVRNGGAVMLVSGVVLIFANLLAAILLIVAGVMCFARKVEGQPGTVPYAQPLPPQQAWGPGQQR